MSSEIGKRDQNSVVVLMGITDDANQEIRMLRVNPVTNRLLVSSNAGLGTITRLPATGSVNGVNAQFTFTQQPTYVMSDHAYYESTNKIGTTNWTWNGGTLTLTMVIPPTEDIVGYLVN